LTPNETNADSKITIKDVKVKDEAAPKPKKNHQFQTDQQSFLFEPSKRNLRVVPDKEPPVVPVVEDEVGYTVDWELVPASGYEPDELLPADAER
jgi:hypothetical protein